MRSLLFQQLLSQHPIPHTPEGSSVLFHRFFTPSLAFAFTSQARLPLAPISGLTFRRRRIHLMLRAVDLLSFLRRLHRFTTTSRPVAMDACYLAACPLPGSDFHRLAVVSFQDTRRGVGQFSDLPIKLELQFFSFYNTVKRFDI
jgi:hypothetical protein